MKTWQNPMDEKEIYQQIEDFMKKNICYEKDNVLGFPGTTPHPIAAAVYNQYIGYHANNIGMHTIKGKREIGFEGSQEAERQVIAMAADLMGAMPDEEIDGYISPGGTEANIVGCWIGRDAQKDKSTAIVCSFLTHYSASKAANLLGISYKAWPKSKKLHLLGTDRNGHLLPDQFQKTINELAQDGIANIIIIGNAGTVMLGSVDDIPAMNEIIEKAKKQFPKTSFHFHIDAAIGGFVVPFIKRLPDIGFQNSAVDSIAIDVHKMGLAPYGSGIIMARQGFFQRIKSIAPYVPGNDYTLCGSRAGAMALSCWAVFRKLGKNGYSDNATKLMQLTEYTQERLKAMKIPAFENDINIIAVKGELPLACKGTIVAHTQEDFPIDLARPHHSKSTSIWNITVMTHTTKEMVDQCLDRYKRAIN